MGVYHDFRLTNRDSWKFIYRGAEILPHAEAALGRFAAAEMDNRNTLADLLRDPNVSHEDRRIAEFKKQIEHAGSERERCAVYVHEFRRAGDREYHLSLGDVTYFGLHESRPAEVR